MRNRIFKSFMLISIAVVILSSAISTSFLHKHFNTEQAENLQAELTVVSNAVDEIGIDYLSNLDFGIYRFTVIDEDGNVLLDTKADENLMDNHSDREEITEALKTGHGSSARYSSTLTEKTFYEATKLKNGDVLRISVSQLTIGGVFIKMLPMNLLILIIAAIVCLILSSRMSRKITEPLEALDLDHPERNNTYDELSPILTKIHKQHGQIKSQIKELHRKNDEFTQIISSMSEGLILLNEQDTIISINSSARKIFGTNDDMYGKDFLLLDRTPELTNALHIAKANGHADVQLEKNGCEYRFTVSVIQSNEKNIGTLILAFDVTDRVFAERNRQEFTANVSHELKTPLQAIIGSAELLENGLVKKDDTNRFVGNIKNEATRLVSLIEDIIHLSELDEKAELEKENVDLCAMSEEIIQTLKPSADKKQVSVSFVGGNITIPCIRRYMYEIIYNLTDNAIRYNKQGGSVTISIKNEQNKTIISVSDTGIGIPPKHHTRIFERFYRVDKSHSKETGGTGLGLAIVKRAAMLHNGSVEVESRETVGTTIKIVLSM